MRNEADVSCVQYDETNFENNQECALKASKNCLKVKKNKIESIKVMPHF